MKALLKSFADVEQTTNEIAGIADVIEDVATSTNLLAMNAAIEAAHAGESGKGFSVVASEIRSLATTTSDNANVISNNIKTIVKQMKNSMELSNKADSVMEKMIDGVAIAEQSFGEIILSQSGISRSTQELTADLESLNETSANLRHSSQEIIEALDAIQNLIASLDDAEANAKTGGPGPSLGLF
jgi:methyl-accepting chemotaxis protein